MVESLFNLAPKDSRGQGGDDADHELFQTGTGIFDHAYFPSAIGQKVKRIRTNVLPIRNSS